MPSNTFSTLRTAGAILRPSLISPAHTCRDPVPTFPTPFNTTVFSQGTGGWFEASLRRAAPKGHATFIYSYSTAVSDPPSTIWLTSRVHVHNGGHVLACVARSQGRSAGLDHFLSQPDRLRGPGQQADSGTSIVQATPHARTIPRVAALSPPGSTITTQADPKLVKNDSQTRVSAAWRTWLCSPEPR